MKDKRNKSKPMRRRGWEKLAGFERGRPSYEREVLGLDLAVWYANGRYWGAVGNGGSIGHSDPNVVARRIEIKASEMFSKAARALKRDALR